MKYSSTRGGVRGLSFEEVLFTGFASDGGMLLPDTVPVVPMETIRTWSSLSYPELVKEVLSVFLTEEDLPRSDLNKLVDQGTSKLTHVDKVPVARLKNGLNILECFHGPSLAFKDLAMTIVGQFFEYFLGKRRTHVNIVVATSGDTGSAAIEAVRDLKWIDIVVLLPRGRTSKTQELQMTTAIADNVHVFRVDGTSDDLDNVMKPWFLDDKFTKSQNLCCLNSVNLLRILAQVAHFFYGYFQVCPSLGKEVEVVLPSGGLGNGAAATIARQMGLPITVVFATNSNDVVARTIDDGVYTSADQTIPTVSPAMDIQMAYNMERIFCVLSGMDRQLVCEMMTAFEKDGGVKIPVSLHEKMKHFMRSFSATDDVILSTMKRCYDENNYIACPHTSVAIAYHYANRDRPDHPPQICVATASPAKFPEAVTKAGLTPQSNPILSGLDSKPTRYVDLEVNQDWNSIIREKFRSLTQAAAECS